MTKDKTRLLRVPCFRTLACIAGIALAAGLRAAPLTTAAELAAVNRGENTEADGFAITATLVRICSPESTDSLCVVDDSGYTTLRLPFNLRPEGLAAGAMGAVLKSVEFVDLANAIRKIAAGEKVIDQEIRRFLRAEPAIEPLSPRQREILDAIVNGLSNADISARFGISLDMVKEHNQKLFEKLGVNNRAEAIAITLRKHLLKI